MGALSSNQRNCRGLEVDPDDLHLISLRFVDFVGENIDGVGQQANLLGQHWDVLGVGVGSINTQVALEVFRINLAHLYKIVICCHIVTP